MTIETAILITGGCGFIGKSLVSKLLEMNPDLQIRVLDNFTTGTPSDLAEVATVIEAHPWDSFHEKGVFLIEGDIRNLDTVMQCTRGVDCIVHLAANTGVASSVEDPMLDMVCNVMGTVNMLEAARLNSVGRFIFASSGAPVGEVEPPIHEELPPHPVSPYGASKLAGEGYCSAYYRTFGVETVCLRFGNVYGPRSRRKTSVVAKFIRQAISGEPCLIYGDGTQTRDFIYIDDLVKAIVACMEKRIGGETFQIATGKEHTVAEMADLLSRRLSQKGIQMTLIHDQPRPGDVKGNFSDTRKARKWLGWSAEVSLEEGIERTIDYFFGERS